MSQSWHTSRLANGGQADVCECRQPTKGEANLADKPAGQRAEAHAEPRERHGIVEAVIGHEVLVDQDEA